MREEAGESKDDHVEGDGNHKFILRHVALEAFKWPQSESRSEVQD